MPGFLSRWDRHALLWVADHRVSFLDPVFEWLTHVGTGGFLWVALALLLAWRTRRPLVPIGVLAAVVVWGSDAVTTALKAVTDRPRPFLSIHHLTVLVARPGSSSFPSGHATTAFAGAVLLGWLWPRGRIGFAVLAISIAFSRIYVGVHYPADVLAAAAVGTSFAVVAIAAVRRTGLGDRLVAPRSAERSLR
jgi:undecaprenyl-diphosphatase